MTAIACHEVQANRVLFDRWVDAFNHRRADLLDELVTADFVDHHVPDGFGTGPAAVGAWWKVLAGAFEARLTPLDVVVDGDRVAARCRYHGRHIGEFAGLPATGRDFDVELHSIERIEDGRIAERWELADVSALTAQLGA